MFGPNQRVRRADELNCGTGAISVKIGRMRSPVPLHHASILCSILVLVQSVSFARVTQASGVVTAKPNSLEFQLIPSQSDVPGTISDAVVASGAVYVLAGQITSKDVTENVRGPYLAKLTASSVYDDTIDIEFAKPFLDQNETRGARVGSGVFAFHPGNPIFAVLASGPGRSIPNGMVDVFSIDDAKFGIDPPIFSFELPHQLAPGSLDRASSLQAKHSDSGESAIYLAAVLTLASEKPVAYVWKVNVITKTILWTHISQSPLQLGSIALATRRDETNEENILLVESGRNDASSQALFVSNLGEADGSLRRSSLFVHNQATGNPILSTAGIGPGGNIFVAEVPGLLSLFRWEESSDSPLLKKLWESPRGTDNILDLAITGDSVDETRVFVSGFKKSLATGGDLGDVQTPILVENPVVAVYNSSREEVFREVYLPKPGLKQTLTKLAIVNDTTGDAIAFGSSTPTSTLGDGSSMISLAAFRALVVGESDSADSGPSATAPPNSTFDSGQTGSDREALPKSNKVVLIGIGAGIGAVVLVCVGFLLLFSAKKGEQDAIKHAEEEEAAREYEEYFEVRPAGDILA